MTLFFGRCPLSHPMSDHTNGTFFSELPELFCRHTWFCISFCAPPRFLGILCAGQQLGRPYRCQRSLCQRLMGTAWGKGRRLRSQANLHPSPATELPSGITLGMHLTSQCLGHLNLEEDPTSFRQSEGENSGPAGILSSAGHGGRQPEMLSA